MPSYVHCRPKSGQPFLLSCTATMQEIDKLEIIPGLCLCIDDVAVV